MHALSRFHTQPDNRMPPTANNRRKYKNITTINVANHYTNSRNKKVITVQSQKPFPDL